MSDPTAKAPKYCPNCLDHNCAICFAAAWRRARYERDWLADPDNVVVGYSQEENVERARAAIRVIEEAEGL